MKNELTIIINNNFTKLHKKETIIIANQRLRNQNMKLRLTEK
jgi:hypothetical protein